MKKLILFVTIILSAKSGFSQFYTFTQLNSPYSNITNSTVISPSVWDYLTVDTVPFPFQFRYFGADFDTFYMAGGFGGFEYYGQGTFGNYELSFFDAPLADLGINQSPVAYSVTGAAPNRILKLEIQNAGFISDQNMTDFADVQVWFYESSNVLEIHNGPNSVTNPDSWYPGFSGPTVALLRDTSTFILLYGPADNAQSSTSFVADYVTGSPSVTNVYRFTPVANGIEESGKLNANVYPNPCNGSLNIFSADIKSDAVFSVYKITGEKVFEQKIHSLMNHLEMDLPSGIYITRIISGQSQFVNPLVILR